MARSTLLALALITVGSMPVHGQDIYDAIDSGDVALVESLLSQDPAVLNAHNDNAMTPLNWAAFRGQVEVVQTLLALGADATIGDTENSQPIHNAGVSGHTDVIETLLASGVDIDARDNNGMTALLFASGRGHTEATLKLLELGANTELANAYGRTPLLNVARESGDADMAQLLIEHGADVDAVDGFGDTPIVLAAWRGFSAIVNLLLDNNADVPVTGDIGVQLVRYSAERGLDRLMSLMVERGVGLSLGNSQGGSLLHAAAVGGSAEIVRLLLDQGLAADSPDVFGWTPLHYAAAKGRFAVAEILVDHGVDINARTLSGHSPFSLANDEEHTEIVNLLVARGGEQSQQQFPELKGRYFGLTPPADTAALFAPDIVSVNWGGHSSVTFSPDGTEAFWTAYTMPSDSGYGHSRIVGSRIENGRWTVPQVPAFASVEGDGDDVPVLSHDGNKLYFMSSRPLQPGGPSSDENIWIVDKTSDGWGDPYPAPGEINSLPMHWQFTLTNSGTIYVAGQGPDVLGRGDIYRSTLVDGAYTTPEHLGDVVNTTAGETSPFIAPDESYLLFASSGHESTDSEMGIYVSWNDGNGGWTEPVHTGILGLCPLVSPDGEYLFYHGWGGDHGGVRWRPAAFLDDLRPTGF